MADIGSLVADLMVNDTQFNRDLNKAAQNTKSFSSKTNRYLAKAEKGWSKISKAVFSYRGALVAAASATALGYFIKRNLDAADTIGKTADKIGITTGKLQEYRFMANRAGVDTSQLDKGLEAFTKRIGELRVGTGALNTHLNKMDEEFKNQLISAKSTGKALDIYMDRMAGLTNASDKAALSAAAFSRTAGIAMVNVVRGGTEEVDKLRKTFKDLGLEIDESLIRNSEEANDRLTDLTTVIKTRLTSAVVMLAPEVAKVAEKMTTWITANDKFIRQDLPEYLEKIREKMRSLLDLADPIAKTAKFIGKALKEALPLDELKLLFDLYERIKGEEWDVSIGRRERPKEELPSETWTKPGITLTPTIDPGLMEKIKEGTAEIEQAWMGVNTEAAKYGELIKMDYEWAEEAWKKEQEHLQFMKELKATAWQEEIAMTADHMSQLDAILEKHAQREIDIENYTQRAKKQAAMNWLSFSVSVGNTLYELSGRQSKALFYLSKVAAVAQATVNAFQAYGNALAFIPPPANIAVAKSMLALGLANAAAIGAVAIGQGPGGASGAGTAAMPTYSASPYTGAPTLSTEKMESGPRLEVHLTFNGPVHGDEEFTEYIVERLNDWVDDRGGRLASSEVVS